MTSLRAANSRHTVIDTVLGELTVVASDDSIIGVYFPHHWTRPDRTSFGVRVDAAADALLDLARTQLVDYLAGERAGFDLPTSVTGTAFQRQVWDLLVEIPRGDTTTYGELAERLGDRALAREVGQAVGQNPLSIIVPCHRVVGKDGRLTGYAGGLARKQALLELEAPAPMTVGRLF